MQTQKLAGAATSLVAINFLTRITTFSPANFTAPYQAQYIQGVQASAPNIVEVLLQPDSSAEQNTLQRLGTCLLGHL